MKPQLVTKVYVKDAIDLEAEQLFREFYYDETEWDTSGRYIGRDPLGAFRGIGWIIRNCVLAPLAILAVCFAAAWLVGAAQ